MTSKFCTSLMILVSATARRTESVVTKRTMFEVMFTKTPLRIERFLSELAATATRETMAARDSVGTSTMLSMS